VQIAPAEPPRPLPPSAIEALELTLRNIREFSQSHAKQREDYYTGLLNNMIRS
jgi:hypothetical protein